ncbi:MAG: hypothetical protein ACQGQO_11680 [Sphaerochaetaceae bacterium]
MIELNNERVDQILHKETQKTEELQTILRALYARHMYLYEKYLGDIDALNDDVIAGLKKYHEETVSLMKYYYMDIPQDTCEKLVKFNEEYTAKLLGADWHKYVSDSYKEFRAGNRSRDKSEECLKAEFSKQNLKSFYEAMDYVFRDAFGTGSEVVENVISGFTSLFFKKDKE